MTRYIVAIYKIDLAYGGPEEGGWYYQYGELDRMARVFRSEEKAHAYRERLNVKLDAMINKHLPSISSVLSEGRFVAEVWERCCPMYYPEKRPHYE